VSRGKNQIELDHRINEWTKTLTVEELEALMIEYSIPAGKMYRAPEMLADPHFAARNSIIDVETERWGTLKMQNAFPKLSDTPSRVRSPAPSEVGQHNAEIYGGLLALDESEIAALKAADAI
jgi:formyl-CoA transferase